MKFTSNFVTQVHEEALAEFKAKVEEDMREFEEKRKEEIEKIQSVGTEEKKQLMVRGGCNTLL